MELKTDQPLIMNIRVNDNILLQQRLISSIIYNDNKLAKDIIKEIVSKKLSLDTQDINKYTALHWACIKGNTDIVELLINSGAERDIQDGDGDTPILVALKEIFYNSENNGFKARHKEIYKTIILLLINSKVNLTIKNKKDYSYSNFCDKDLNGFIIENVKNVISKYKKRKLE